MFQSTVKSELTECETFTFLACKSENGLSPIGLVRSPSLRPGSGPLALCRLPSPLPPSTSHYEIPRAKPPPHPTPHPPHPHITASFSHLSPRALRRSKHPSVFLARFPLRRLLERTASPRRQLRRSTFPEIPRGPPCQPSSGRT